MVVLLVFLPSAGRGAYTEVQREGLLETEEEWIIQFNIINNEGRTAGYIIEVRFDDTRDSEPVSIENGKIFTYIYHLGRDEIKSGEVTMTIYQDGIEDPIEKLTYHLR